MAMQEQLDKDLKTALLAGDRIKSEVIKGLKNAIAYEALSINAPDKKLTQEQIQKVFAREAKKRQEAADLYKQGGNNEKAQAELAEKKIIEEYLPEQMDEAELMALVKAEIAAVGSPTMADMGKIIGAVKAKAGASADGAVIARIVKENLS